MALDKKIIKDYNSTRKLFHKKHLCNAPFINIYFNIHGDAAPCWLGFINPDRFPDKTISEIWFGEKFNQVRKNISDYTLEKTCGVCLSNLQNRNFISVLAKAYENVGKSKKYPLMMELELENTCNFECIMCNGFLSSSIRKNREHKSAFNSPYNDSFVHQLNEFIPHLKEIRFNGGEPFLSEICYKIWNNIFLLNPNLNIVVATNGSVWNQKIEQIIEKGKFNINISIDSLTKEIYESIRINGNFEKTMSNFDKFLQYCKRKKTKLCVMVNPMRENWHEMGDFVNFCNKHNVPLWFNTIQHPAEHSLWALPTEELAKIHNTLSKLNFPPSTNKPESYHNKNVFENLVDVQIYNWMIESSLPKQTNQSFATMEDLNLAFHQLLKKQGLDKKQINIELEILNSKLNQLAIFLKEVNIEQSDFFKMLDIVPIEFLYEQIITKSISELILQLKKMLV